MKTFCEELLIKEISEISLPDNYKIDPKIRKFGDKYNINIEIYIDSGVYSNRNLFFTFLFSEEFPFVGPKIICKNKIFHPNIFEGHVCLSILRDEWLPSYTLETLIVSLNTIFFDFDSYDAINPEAGDLIDENFDEFVKKAKNIK